MFVILSHELELYTNMKDALLPLSFDQLNMKSTKLALSLLDHKPCLSISQLKQLQSQLTISGAISDRYFAGKLISSFSDHHTHFSHSYHLLLHLPHRSTFMFNSLLKVLTETNQPIQSLSLYKHMLLSGFHPNNYTFSFLIRSCVDVGDSFMGKMLHSQCVKMGWESYDFVRNGLIHLYAVSGDVDSCRKLFDVSLYKDVVTWTAVVNGYVKVGQVDDARQVFDEMPERNDVSWSTMIAGYSQMGFFKEALELFNEMLVSGFRPNHASIVGALTACASLGALDQGRWIHAYVDRTGIVLDAKLGTALVDMYAKCGCIEIACRVFEDMQYKDVFAFTSLISGLSNHGLSDNAINLFKRMQNEGIDPNGVTFICVLTACSRIGLIDEGLEIFKSMKNRYGIEPGVEHYGCLVDLLARAGMLKESEHLVRMMAMMPDSYVLGALLNACRVHGNVELGEETAKQLMNRGLDYSGVHTLLSNIYASANKWDGVAKVREKMEEKEVKKVPGCSLIEVDGVVSEFGAGQRSHMLMEEIMTSLLWLDKHLRSFRLDHDRSCTIEIAYF